MKREASQAILDFWFVETDRKAWFARSTAFDELIRHRFTDSFDAVTRGETAHWRNTSAGRLAEIIVLDQFSRNLFRGEARAFAADPVALALAQELLRSGEPGLLEVDQRMFAFMPFMHSESAVVHETAMHLFKDLPSFGAEKAHKEVIDRFGRYPHRNAALGRTSTDEEIRFMQTHKGF